MTGPRAGARDHRYRLLYDRAELVAAAAVWEEMRLAREHGPEGAVFQHDGPGPAMATAAARIEDLLTVALLAVCPHADRYAPVALYWHGWDPDTLACAACAAEAFERLTVGGGVEPRCDHCLADVPPAAVYSWMRRPYIYDDDPPEVMPPVVVRLRLCEACAAIDAARSQER